MIDTVFFFASKLIWGVLRPDMILLILLAVGVFLLWRGRMQGAKWALTFALLGYGAVMFSPIAHVAMHPLENRFPVKPEVQDPAGIILLGGAERAELSAHWGQITLREAGERYIAVIALARTYPDAKVFFSGGSGSLRSGVPSESLVAEEIFLSAGIAPERLVLEGTSRNTAENVAFLSEMVEDPGEKPWILVTSAHHLPRAVGVFCAAGWSNIVPYPTDFRSGLPRSEMRMKFADNIENLNRASKEWLGLLVYWVTGRSSEFFPKGC